MSCTCIYGAFVCKQGVVWWAVVYGSVNLRISSGIGCVNLRISSGGVCCLEWPLLEFFFSVRLIHVVFLAFISVV